MGLTLITPTNGRPRAFSLCESWMARQTYRGPVQWIVADDGKQRANPAMGQEHICREPCRNPKDSFRGNLLAALERVQYDKVLFIEDDDWYAPDYLDYMSMALDHAVLAGEARAKYYHVQTRRYHVCGNTTHASMCQTGIRGELVPVMAEQIGQHRTTFVDMRLWNKWSEGYSRSLAPKSHRAVGIKGLPGRDGIGMGHRPPKGWPEDADGSILREWVGADADVYLGMREQE